MIEADRELFMQLIEAVEGIASGAVEPPVPPDPVECPIPRRQGVNEKNKDYCNYMELWLDSIGAD